MITLNNYEEYLLDYLHGELAAEEVVEMEAFIQQHDNVRDELALLKRTILTPEARIQYPDKSLLFKKAENNFVVKYKRPFAAAAVVSGIILGILSQYHKGPQEAHTNPPLSAQTEHHTRPADNVHDAIPQAETISKTAQTNSKSLQPNQKARLSASRKIDAKHKPDEAFTRPESSSIVKEKSHPVSDENISPEKPAAQIEKEPDLQTPSVPAVALQPEEPVNEVRTTSKNAIALDKQKQPGLFRTIAKLVKFSRNIKDKKESLANTEITVIVGNRKILNLN